MKLYRGDNIFNKRTKPGLFRNNGLLSKSFGGGGDPMNIERIGLIETITKHIRPQSEMDNRYYDVSDFISFSSNPSRAIFWCADKGQKVLVPACDYGETRYIFVMDIDENKLERVSEGMYLFSYLCNMQKRTSDLGGFEIDLFKAMYEGEKCPICQTYNQSHKLLLINAVEYLQCHPNQVANLNSIENAKQDMEWLILPLDLDRDNFRESRIQRSDFWGVKLYTVEGELRPINVNSYYYER